MKLSKLLSSSIKTLTLTMNFNVFHQLWISLINIAKIFIYKVEHPLSAVTLNFCSSQINNSIALYSGTLVAF